jgi:hypothetical protein
MNSAPGVPSDVGADVGTIVGIVVITDVGLVVGFVVNTDVGLVVGTVVGTDVAMVVPGVGIAGMGVFSVTISFVGVTAGAVLVGSGLTQPLNKTIVVTRTMKNRLLTIFSFPGP